MNLANCVGILDIIAESSAKLKSCERCPKCNSDDVLEKRKCALMICGECGHKESLLLDHGLEHVVKSTMLVLPDIVRENFVAAQNVSFTLKEETSRRVISEFWDDFSFSKSHNSLFYTITRMIARLSLVWEFSGHGKEIGTLLASDLVASLKLNTKAHLWHRKKLVPSKSQRLHLVSLGILWNLCLRDLAHKLVHTWARELQNSGHHRKSGEWSSTCTILFHDVFAAMNEENLKHIESELLLGDNFSDVLKSSEKLKIL